MSDSSSRDGSPALEQRSRLTTPERESPTALPEPVQSNSPVKSKPYTIHASSGQVGDKAETKAYIHKSVKKEVMNATFYDVDGLVQNRLPDALFDRLCRPLEEDDDIVLVPEPPKQPDEGGAQDPQSGVSQTNHHAERHGPQPAPNGRPVESRKTSGVFQNIRKRFTSSKPVSGAASPLDEIFDSLRYGNRPLYDRTRKRWKRWPKTNKINQEKAVADFLNTLVDRACQYFNDKRSAAGLEELKAGRFFSNYANTPVKSVGAVRKPDIVLCYPEDENSQESGWKLFRAIIEIKSNVKLKPQECSGGLAESVRLNFGNQRARRFILCFSLIDTKMHLWKFDRSGVLVSKVINVHADPKDFLRVVLGMALGEDYYLGYDPSFFRKNGQDYIKLNRKEYRIVDDIQMDAVIRGRGTVTLLVKDEETGRPGVIKDQWVDRSRETKEFRMLRKLRESNMKNVPELLDYQYVHFKVGNEGIFPDSTETDRDSEDMKERTSEVETRDHYRLLITPYGDKLESFMSLKELVLAIWDFVKVIRALHERDIVHRDISLRNVILVQEEDCLTRKGYVIDFDYAVELARTELAQAERTGTFPFMAIEVLMNSCIKHMYYHDLESLFYVLIWICLVQEGPRNRRRPDSELDVEKSPLHHWCGTTDKCEVQMRSIALMKQGMTTSATKFRQCILPHLPDYFKSLKGLLLGLRHIIFDEESDFSEGKPGVEIQGETISIKRREPKEVFDELDRLFEKELASLPDEPLPPKPSTEQDSERHDSGVFMSSFPPYSDLRPLNVMASKQKDAIADGTPKSGTMPSLHAQALVNAARSNGSCGVKRSHDWEKTDDCVPLPSTSSSKRSRQTKKQ